MTLEYEQLLEDMEKERQTRLTPHFTLAEMTRTSVRGADNTPSEEAVENLRRLCGWLEMLREEWNLRYGEGNDPIIVSSGYRSAEVNRAVGGSTTSNHLTECAADIRACGPEQALRYATILLDISDNGQEAFDELLLEHKGCAYWVHFAVRPQGNRRRIRIVENSCVPSVASGKAEREK